jgi:hypothetical protein
MAHASTRSAGSGAARARLILPVAGAGVLIACGLVLLRQTPEQHTVSQVKRALRERILTAPRPGAPAGAGELGPWRIRAADYDALSGSFTNLRVESGPVMLSASAAELLVDASSDSITFELRDVVYTRIPQDREDGDADAFVHELAQYRLGPIPYDLDIIPDSAASN